MQNIGDFANSIEALGPVLKLAAKEGKKKLAEVQFGFQKYLERVATRNAKYKTVLSSGLPVDFKDSYVPSRLSVENKIIDENTFVSYVDKYNQTIIQATGGSGKSMFMRWLLFKYIDIGEKIPLFIELRYINKTENKSLTDIIVQQVNVPFFDADTLVTALRTENFVLLLDGFDEIHFEDRADFADQLFSLIDEIPQLNIIISSRPGEDFAAWRSFAVFRMEPLSQDQAVRLIQQTPEIDNETKANFVARIRKDLWQSHQSFLQTPLLCLMTYLTFMRDPNIESKMHLFYRQAFDALYSRHDALKANQFSRPHKSKFDVEEFSDVFSYFSLSTYVREELYMAHDLVVERVKEALGHYQKITDAEDFIHDMVQGVCLLIEDAGYYTYTHRSFQEYFSAIHIARQDSDTYKRYIDRIHSRREFDTTVHLVAAIDRNRFEREWALESLQYLLNNISRNSTDDVSWSFYKTLFPNFGLEYFEEGIDLYPTNRTDQYDSKLLKTFRTLMQEYPKLDSRYSSDDYRSWMKKNKGIVANIVAEKVKSSVSNRKLFQHLMLQIKDNRKSVGRHHYRMQGRFYKSDSAWMDELGLLESAKRTVEHLQNLEKEMATRIERQRKDLIDLI
jgi:hypothetical protein